jgi:hypothetical protein
MNDRHIIVYQCSIVFCIFIAFYNYQVQAADIDNAAASENTVGTSKGSETIRISIRGKNGGLTQISLDLTLTVRDLKEKIYEIIDIPPAKQKITARGAHAQYNWSDDTLLKDIEELPKIGKISHLTVFFDNDSLIATFDKPLQHFLKNYESDSVAWIKVLEKLKITQLEQIGNCTEKELLEAGLKIIPAKKLLEYYSAFTKPIIVSEPIGY